MHKWAIMGPLEARCFKVDLRVKARVRVLSGWSLLAKLIVMMIEAEAPESACLFSAYEKEEQAIIDPPTHTHTRTGDGVAHAVEKRMPTSVSVHVSAACFFLPS